MTPPALPPTPPTDGRTARAQRTRRSVVEALEALLTEGVVAPSAAQIARRANVSTRSIYGHFSSLEDLFGAVAERTTQRTLSLLRPIDPDAGLDERIDEICAQRAQVNEEIGPIRRAAARQDASSPTLAASRALGRTASREQVARIFGRELDRLPVEQQAGRIGAVDALLSGETWDLLRGAHGLTAERARAATTDGLRQLLGQPRS